jgi:hypothetical protein
MSNLGQNEELSLTINSEQLQHSACEKLLRIKIDSNLNWKNQIDQICSKISSKIYLFHLQHFGESKDFYQTSIRYYFF